MPEDAIPLWTVLAWAPGVRRSRMFVVQAPTPEAAKAKVYAYMPNAETVYEPEPLYATLLV